MKKIILAILDGMGLREETYGNAVKNAKTKALDKLIKEFPHSKLDASGEAVGLPKGQMGNSEVGHITIGTGRIIDQPLQKINKALEDGSFYTNKNIVEAKDRDEENLISNEVLQASAIEEKILPTAEFAMKKVYNECGHFKFEYAELPQELVNLTEEELEAYYKDWEIEEFSPSKIILTKEINSLCDEHFIIKLGEKYVQVFHLEPDGNLVVYETTDISREYLPEEDIKKLEEGIYVFGEGKLNSVLEDFE